MTDSIRYAYRECRILTATFKVSQAHVSRLNLVQIPKVAREG